MESIVTEVKLLPKHTECNNTNNTVIHVKQMDLTTVLGMIDSGHQKGESAFIYNHIKLLLRIQHLKKNKIQLAQPYIFLDNPKLTCIESSGASDGFKHSQVMHSWI